MNPGRLLLLLHPRLTKLTIPDSSGSDTLSLCVDGGVSRITVRNGGGGGFELDRNRVACAVVVPGGEGAVG